MNTFRIPICSLVVLSTTGFAQTDSLALRFAATITEGELREHLEVLAGDPYEGRETGERGQKMAAEYLKQQFASSGIPPLPDGTAGVAQGYFQPFDLIVERPGTLSLTIDGIEFPFLKDLLYFRDHVEGGMDFRSVMYCPSGELGSLPPETKAAMVIQAPARGIAANDPGLEGMGELTELANMKELELLLICTQRYPQAVDRFGHRLRTGRMRLASGVNGGASSKGTQVMIVSPAVAQRVLGRVGLSFAREWNRALKGKRAPTRSIDVEMGIMDHPFAQEIQSENVLAYIEGGDLKEELLVVTAHYDHVGVQEGEVYNGADDDGSGTVALLEMAEAFAIAKAQGRGPRRSLLFMPVTAEEKGLLGSKYFSENPVFPIESIVANLNIDMIGRFDSAHIDSDPYVYIIGSNRLSTELHRINQQASETYVGLILDETFNAKDDPNQFYYRSDHYSFARKGVPVIFYFSGVHEDYHQPGDEVDKIRFDLLLKRTLLVFHTAWILANQDERPVIDGRSED